jgi:SAM-dependent methyltransferase
MSETLYRVLNTLCGGPRQVTVDEGMRLDVAKAQGVRSDFLDRWGRFIRPATDVLVVGCAWDGQELRWFAERARSVVGIDINREAITWTKRYITDLPNVRTCVVPPDSLPFRDKVFDVVFMHNVCEHLRYLERCFCEYHRVLKTHGTLLNDFGPLFYSPFGAHMFEALKVPWGHLFFGVKTLVAIRNRYYPGTCTARTWQDLGLNRVTNARYRQIAQRAGFRVQHHGVSTVRQLPVLQHLPGLRNLFITGVESVLWKPSRRGKSGSETIRERSSAAYGCPDGTRRQRP